MCDAAQNRHVDTRFKDVFNKQLLPSDDATQYNTQARSSRPSTAFSTYV